MFLFPREQVEYILHFSVRINVYFKGFGAHASVRHAYRSFYVATGVVQRRDVLILYSVILISSTYI